MTDMPTAYGQTSGIVTNIGTEARLALQLAPLTLTAQEEVDAYRAALQTIVSEVGRADALWDEVDLTLEQQWVNQRSYAVDGFADND